ncbi:unnamed protein product [uncultured virus]|nr:unnamed protein product [uncultured virus]
MVPPSAPHTLLSSTRICRAASRDISSFFDRFGTAAASSSSSLAKSAA